MRAVCVSRLNAFVCVDNVVVVLVYNRRQLSRGETFVFLFGRQPHPVSAILRPIKVFITGSVSRHARTRAA